MSQEYRVHVYLVDFDKTRAAELTQILKLYHNSQGAQWFRTLLRGVAEGEAQEVYETNSDDDARRVGLSIMRAGGQLRLDGLNDAPEAF